MPAFNVVVCAWAIMVETVQVLTGKCPSNHVDLKYWINSSASRSWGFWGLSYPAESWRNKGYCSSFMDVSWCLMISHEDRSGCTIQLLDRLSCEPV